MSALVMVAIGAAYLLAAAGAWWLVGDWYRWRERREDEEWSRGVEQSAAYVEANLAALRRIYEDAEPRP